MDIVLHTREGVGGIEADRCHGRIVKKIVVISTRFSILRMHSKLEEILNLNRNVLRTRIAVK